MREGIPNNNNKEISQTKRQSFHFGMYICSDRHSMRPINEPNNELRNLDVTYKLNFVSKEVIHYIKRTFLGP